MKKTVKVVGGLVLLGAAIGAALLTKDVLEYGDWEEEWKEGDWEEVDLTEEELR